jgi:hypothetical protein
MGARILRPEHCKFFHCLTTFPLELDFVFERRKIQSCTLVRHVPFDALEVLAGALDEEFSGYVKGDCRFSTPYKDDLSVVTDR